MKAPSTLQAEKVARDMDLWENGFARHKYEMPSPMSKCLRGMLTPSDCLGRDHLWDETLPSYSELLENYIACQPAEGVLSSAAKPKRGGAPTSGPQARKRKRVRAL